MTYASAGHYGITIIVRHGDRKLSWREVESYHLAKQLREFADMLEDEEGS